MRLLEFRTKWEDLIQYLTDHSGCPKRAFKDALDVISVLETAIQKHHDQTVGHNMCWENDVELWRAAGIEAEYPHGTTPPWAEFMTKCAEYRASRELRKRCDAEAQCESVSVGGFAHDTGLLKKQVSVDCDCEGCVRGYACEEAKK